MKIRIEYCIVWNYEPHALRARDLILSVVLDADIKLVGGGGGVFNIDVDGRRAYSKIETGTFPTDNEVRSAVT